MADECCPQEPLQRGGGAPLGVLHPGVNGLYGGFAGRGGCRGSPAGGREGIGTGKRGDAFGEVQFCGAQRGDQQGGGGGGGGGAMACQPDAAGSEGLGGDTGRNRANMAQLYHTAIDAEFYSTAIDAEFYHIAIDAEFYNTAIDAEFYSTAIES